MYLPYNMPSILYESDRLRVEKAPQVGGNLGVELLSM